MSSFTVVHSSSGNDRFHIQKFMGMSVLDILATGCVTEKYQTMHELIGAKSKLLSQLALLRFSDKLGIEIEAVEEITPSLRIDCFQAFIGFMSIGESDNIIMSDFMNRLMAEELSVTSLDYKSLLQDRIGHDVMYVTKSHAETKGFHSTVWLKGALLGEGLGSKKKIAEAEAARAALG